VKIIDCKQGSPEWLQARLGVVTASEMDALVSPTWEVRKGEGPKTYLYRKLAERLMGAPLSDGGTWAMDQGNIGETMARPWYEFQNDVDVRTVGLCVTDDGRAGASPDGLVGEDGGLEIKCPQPAKHLEYLDAGEVPKQYRVQVQMFLYVTGRQWCDFISYSPFLPQLVVRVTPDTEAALAISEALAGFYMKFDATLARITSRMPAQGRADK
jgi:putative phage-type endonuclease